MASLEALIMPAESQKQQIAMAIAEHEPEKLNADNKGMLDMSHQQLHDFASTPRKHLPYSAAHKARKSGEKHPSYPEVRQSRK
jgi:hypothetical protein